MDKKEPAKVFFPVTFYRLEDQGKDKMFWIDNFGDTHGRDTIPIFSEIKHPVTGEIISQKEKIGERVVNTMSFNQNEFKKLLSQSTKLLPPNKKLRFYIKVNRKVSSVSPEQFAEADFTKVRKAKHL